MHERTWVQDHGGSMEISRWLFNWMIALIYRAFAVSCNVSGKVARLVFIIVLVVGEIISKVIILRMFPVSMVA